MTQHRQTEKQVAYMAFLNRENLHRHHYYDEEMKQYQLMQAGDPAAVEESVRMFTGALHGHLSDDRLQNVKFLFVACMTLTCRFAIEGGMDSETAYNTSDLYIGRADRCRTVDEVLALHREMFQYFTDHMAGLKKAPVIARPVLQCMDYIDAHLHEKLGVEALAEQVGLSQSYLSTLFKKETGVAVSEYILKRRIETAQNMLLYSDFSAAQISSFLAFSSQSYFIQTFRRITGMTPREYQSRNFRKGIQAASREE